MKITDLSENLQMVLGRMGIEAFSPEQEKILKKYKSGSDIFSFIDNKEDNMLLCAIFLVNSLEEYIEDFAPRALVFVNSVDDAEYFNEIVKKLALGLELLTVLVHDKGNKIMERNKLYEGADIVVGTPKRITELYFQNGINLKLLKHIFMFNSYEIFQNAHSNKVSRIFESLKKCQKIFHLDKKSEKIEEFEEEFMRNPILLK